MNNQQPLLLISNLKKYYPVGKTLFGKPTSLVKAVDDVSLTVNHGETVGLVGESGCGKSTFGKCVLLLEQPTEGNIRFDGDDLLSLSQQALREKRKMMQPVFQDPYSSLNPRRTIGSILEEPFRIHNLYSKRERRERALELLKTVGMLTEHYQRFPHEFSGGQRQRIAIARALTLNPSLIVADEPVSALDVSIQAQILNLIVDLQQQFQLALLFISHDLAVVRHITDRVAVMYHGRIVEISPTAELYENPRHPYTRALLSAIPVADPGRKKTHEPVAGETLSVEETVVGCPFAPRCEHCNDRCSKESPGLVEMTSGHYVSCFQLDF